MQPNTPRKVPEKVSDKVRKEKLEKARERNLLRRYGITLDQYNEMLEKQEHSCGLCGRHESEFKTRLAVDHNHVTGEIRGLLCSYCNHRVVGRHRDPELIRKLYEYLLKETGMFVPKNRPKKRKRQRKKKA